jgi:hypothetical protein
MVLIGETISCSEKVPKKANLKLFLGMIQYLSERGLQSEKCSLIFSSNRFQCFVKQAQIMDLKTVKDYFLLKELKTIEDY